MVRLSSTLAAAAAALSIALPLVSADADDKTVKYTFQRRKVNAQDPEFTSLVKRQSKTINAGLSNELLLYLINVTVGTPPQPISLQLDTGSSDIWFPSAQSSICESRRTGYVCSILGAYNQYNSTTYSPSPYANFPFQIAYVDGTQIAGTYINDVLTIGSTKLTNVTMASATQLDRALGIMGVGFNAGESSNVQGGFRYDNVISVMKNEGYINRLSYSLWLDDVNSDTGNVLFGGIDSSKYRGSLIALPIQRDADSGGFTSFTVSWTNLIVSGGGNNADFSPSSPQPAILDSGTTLTYLPDAIANQIYSGVGVTQDQTYGNIVPCKLANDNLTFSFVFGGTGGATINVPLSEMVIPISTTDGSVPKYRNGDAACQFGIDSAGSNPILLGDTLLRSAYVVYDLENLQIALAQANWNPSGSNVVALSSGTGIPGVTSTASAATVAQTFSGRTSISQVSTVTGASTIAATGTRSPTFNLASGTATSSGTAASSSRSAAGRAAEMDKSVFAVLAVTLGAFLFGMLMM